MKTEDVENKNLIKILIGIIIALVLVIGFIIIGGGIYQFMSMKNKISEMEKVQKEQEKRQLENQMMASVQTQAKEDNKKNETKTKTETKEEPKGKLTTYKSSLNYYSELRRRMARTNSRINMAWNNGDISEMQEIYNNWDKELTDVYKSLMAKLSDNEKIKLRNTERSWIKIKDRAIENARNGVAPEYSELVGTLEAIKIIRARSYELAQMYDKLSNN